MTTTAVFGKSAVPRGAVGRFPAAMLAAAKRWWLAYVKWRIEREAVSRPWLLSDRELEDIELARTEILRAVNGELARMRASGL